MRKALTDLGVLEPRFGWGELADHGMAIVSGPPSYIQLVETTIRNLPARAQQIKVFRLRHASAQDRTVPYRGQELNIPGLASILRGMVGGGAGGSGPAPGLQVTATGAVRLGVADLGVAGLGGSGLGGSGS